MLGHLKLNDDTHSTSINVYRTQTRSLQNRNARHRFQINGANSYWLDGCCCCCHSFVLNSKWPLFRNPFEIIEFPRLMFYPFEAFCSHLFCVVTRLAHQLERITYCPCGTIPMPSLLLDWSKRRQFAQLSFKLAIIFDTAKKKANGSRSTCRIPLSIHFQWLTNVWGLFTVHTLKANNFFRNNIRFFLTDLRGNQKIQF